MDLDVSSLSGTQACISVLSAALFDFDFGTLVHEECAPNVAVDSTCFYCVAMFTTDECAPDVTVDLTCFCCVAMFTTDECAPDVTVDLTYFWGSSFITTIS